MKHPLWHCRNCQRLFNIDCWASGHINNAVQAPKIFICVYYRLKFFRYLVFQNIVLHLQGQLHVVKLPQWHGKYSQGNIHSNCTIFRCYNTLQAMDATYLYLNSNYFTVIGTLAMKNIKTGLNNTVEMLILFLSLQQKKKQLDCFIRTCAIVSVSFGWCVSRSRDVLYLCL